MEPANFAELKSKIDNWDISAEELLLQKMKVFTINYNEEFQQFCRNMDNFSNSMQMVEVEHLKAINQIKTISRDKFIENALDKGEESESESVSNENNFSETSTPTPGGIQITNVESIKTAMEISLNCLNEINKKNKNKEEIEDDTVSVASSKIMMDKGAKMRLPFIIGTEEFKADKAIGLNVAIEEEEPKDKEKEEEENEDDSEIEEYLADINVDEKRRKKWEKVKKKREKKRKKEKEKKKLEEAKTLANKTSKNEEVEVKVPIENESEEVPNAPKDPNALVVLGADPAKSGGAIPPPPPPPPPPPVIPTIPKGKQNNNKMPSNPQIPNDIINPQNVANNPENPVVNTEINNNPSVQQQPPLGQTMDFQTMLRNRLQQQNSNQNNNPNINIDIAANANLANNNVNPNSVSDIIHTDADNKNPLAPVKRDNVILKRENVKLNAFGGLNFLGGDDEDDDYDDLSSNLFKRKPSALKNPLQEQNPQMSQIMQNNEENKPPSQTMMIMGMPRPSSELPSISQQNENQNNIPQIQIPSGQGPQMIKPPQLQMQMSQEKINQQPPQVQMSMQQPQIMQPQFNLFQNQTETKAIEIKKNRDLENARNKLKNMFDSDDEEDDNPSNIVDKTASLTMKVNLFAGQSEPSEKKPMDNLFGQEPKQNVVKPKLSLFGENENEIPKTQNNNFNTNVNANLNLNSNINFNVNSEQSKPKVNLFADLGNANQTNENNINIAQSKPKPKLSFFNEDDNEQDKEPPKIEQIKLNPQPEKEKPQEKVSFLDGLKEKIGNLNQNNIQKEPEPIKPQIEIQEQPQPQVKVQGIVNEKPKIDLFGNPNTVVQPQPVMIKPNPDSVNQLKPQPEIIIPKTQPEIPMPKPEVENHPKPQPEISMPKPQISNKPKIDLFANIPQQQKEQIKPPAVKPQEEPKNEGLKKNPIQGPVNKRFSAMQNMLANRIGQKGGMMMMMGGPPPRKEEVKIEHDENVSQGGTGETNYEAVVKKTAVVKKKKPKRSGAFGGGTTVPMKTTQPTKRAQPIPPKIEIKPEISIEKKNTQFRPKVNLFLNEEKKEEVKPKVNLFFNEVKNKEVKPLDVTDQIPSNVNINLNQTIPKDEPKPASNLFLQEEKKVEIKPPSNIFFQEEERN